MTFPKIGIYAGSGTSHSWLWFVDLLEKTGMYHLWFPDEFSVRDQGLDHLDVLIISGGDTFAVAKALGPGGARRIKRFVENGGTYIGSCAGAYLPMKSSKKPLDLFNFADIKITNLSKKLPQAIVDSCKFCTAYGCDFVFHPVREAVTLKTAASRNPHAVTEFDAPLYGGPGMTARNEEWVLARYTGFTQKTRFLTGRDIAEKTLLTRAAVVRVPYGKGCFFLMGPHLEHPGYKTANHYIIDTMIRPAAEDQNRASSSCPGQNMSGKPQPPPEFKALMLTVRRELSNSRIVASNLEFLPIRWLIGQKVYEPQKVRVYLESMWKRLKRLEKMTGVYIHPDRTETLTRTCEQTTLALRKIKQQVDAGIDSLETAMHVFQLLHTLAISFFDLYFAGLSAGSHGDFSKKDRPNPTRDLPDVTDLITPNLSEIGDDIANRTHTI